MKQKSLIFDLLENLSKLIIWQLFSIKMSILWICSVLPKGYRPVSAWLKIQIWVTDSVCFIEKYHHRMSEIKQELYDKAGIGIPHLDSECNDVAIFG